MASTIGQARVNITQVTSGVYNQDNRNSTAQAINDLLEQLVQLANTKYNDQYLYGGADTATTPYAVERDNGEITSVTYQGSMESRTTNVAPGVSAGAFYVGQDLFSSDNRSTPVFSGDTGAAAGTGTSSVTGDAWLTVTFDGTNYQLSIDDGATTVTVPTGGNANQAVTDSRTGKVLYVDSTGINKTGTESVRVPGTYNAFDMLISIRDILKNDRNLSDQQIEQARNATTGSLEEMQNLLIQKQASMGSKVGFLGNLQDGLASVKANTEDQTSRLQEADIAQIAIDLSRQQVLYQASLAVAGKMMSLSLLDFIQ
jgi:flagellar hook-associated protein 3 FlgL